MGKVVKDVVGVAVAVVGVVTGQPYLIMAGLSLTASALLTPKAKQTERQASVLNLQVGEVAREAILGEVVTGGSLVDGFNYGGKYGTDWEVLVIALADHECEALVGFYVDDQYVAFTGDGNVAGFNNQLQVYFRKGTETQTALPLLTANSGGAWTANDRGVGVCYVAVAYKADAADAKNPVWQGRPSFRWRLKGAKCYVARKDSTVTGGSGAHRRATPSTWEWTDNLYDCRYAWVRGIYACNRVNDPTMLLVGRGLNAIEAPPENTFAPANLCDEVVDGEKRYTIGAVVRADDQYIAVEEMVAAACGGVITQIEGSVEIEPGQAKAAALSFTDADLVVGSSVDYREFLSRADDEWTNTIVPRYVEPAQNWADHAAPIRRVDADVIADGGPREEVLALSFVNKAKQAGRVAEIRRRLGRLWKRSGVVLGPRFARLEAGDWVEWTSARYFNGETRTFRIDAASLDEKWRSTIRLREVASSVYTTAAFIADTASATALPTPPAIGQPGALAWAVAGLQLSTASGAVPALVVTGAVDDVYASAIRFEYWRNDGVTPPASVTDWIEHGRLSPATVRTDITSTAPGAVYYVAVSYIVDGEPGTRRILGPVAASTASIPLGNVTGFYGDPAATGAEYTNTNPKFVDWRTGQANPTGWVITNPGGATITKAAGLGTPNALEVASVAGQPVQHGQVIGSAAQQSVASDQYLLIEGDVRLVAGTLAGAGLRLEFYGADNSYKGVQTIVLATDAAANTTGSAAGAGTVGAEYSFRKTVRAPAGSFYYVFAMDTALAIHGSIAAARTLRWRKAGVRPASDSEIRAFVGLTPSGDVARQLPSPTLVPPITSANLSYKFTGAITYSAAAGTPATATISVGAGQLLIGNTPVSYNAMSAAVSGTAGTTVAFHLYVDDATFSGGTKTLVATTNGNDVYASNARVWIGTCEVTFPTSGTGSGGGRPGGGGGYGNVDP